MRNQLKCVADHRRLIHWHSHVPIAAIRGCLAPKEVDSSIYLCACVHIFNIRLGLGSWLCAVHFLCADAAATRRCCRQRSVAAAFVAVVVVVEVDGVIALLLLAILFSAR